MNAFRIHLITESLSIGTLLTSKAIILMNHECLFFALRGDL